MAPADSELEAMRSIAAALEGLDEEARGRVLRWAADRFKMGGAAPDGHRGGSGSHGEAKATERQFPDFASLYDRAKPSAESEKALVAGYWLQQIESQKDFTGFGANRLLKNLGHPIATVPREFNRLISTRPNLVMVVKKRGKTMQARKTYRLTAEGIKRVENMLSGESKEGKE